ncbi:hypothetical protein VTL71DRAFT_14728 [Oculimacula yallundae]|uniref:non-specific serine/threonine protein kinase n=1 Tax=Oculimacula yallundae TaxID=86028 RepID=A0ABR4CJF8_9HELO
MPAAWGCGLPLRIPKRQAEVAVKPSLAGDSNGLDIDLEGLDFQVVNKQGEYLGEGSYGKVSTEYDKTYGLVACKSIHFNSGSTGIKDRRNAESECKVLKALSHENIVKYIHMEVTEGPVNSEIRLLMESCEYGSLKDLIQSRKPFDNFLSENYLWSIMNQISAALNYCHFGPQKTQSLQDGQNGTSWSTILHRDIKPANILLASRSEMAGDAIKLADFGLSITIHGNFDPKSYVGTALYRAPEISSEKKKICWTKECDMYSFGLTMYELCCLNHPFDDRRETALDNPPPLPDRYSKHLRQLISRTKSFQPSGRPNAATVYTCTSDTIAMEKKGIFWTVKESLLARLEREMFLLTMGRFRKDKFSFRLQDRHMQTSKKGDLTIFLAECENIHFYSEMTQDDFGNQATSANRKASPERDFLPKVRFEDHNTFLSHDKLFSRGRIVLDVARSKYHQAQQRNADREWPTINATLEGGSAGPDSFSDILKEVMVLLSKAFMMQAEVLREISRARHVTTASDAQHIFALSGIKFVEDVCTEIDRIQRLGDCVHLELQSTKSKSTSKGAKRRRRAFQDWTVIYNSKDYFVKSLPDLCPQLLVQWEKKHLNGKGYTWQGWDFELRSCRTPNQILCDHAKRLIVSTDRDMKFIGTRPMFERYSKIIRIAEIVPAAWWKRYGPEIEQWIFLRHQSTVIETWQNLVRETALMRSAIADILAWRANLHTTKRAGNTKLAYSDPKSASQKTTSLWTQALSRFTVRTGEESVEAKGSRLKGFWGNISSSLASITPSQESQNYYT